MAGSIDFPGGLKPAPAGAAQRPGLFRIREAAQTDAGPNISFKLLLLFLVMLYSQFPKMYPQVEIFRPTLTIAAGAIFMMILELGMNRQPFRFNRPLSYLLFGFLAVAAVSSVDAIYVRAAVDTTADFIKVVLIYVVLENTITSESRLRTVMMTIVFGGLFPAIGTIQHYIQGLLVEGSRGAWIGVFANPNEDAYSLVVLVPIAAMLASKSRWLLRIVLYGVISIYTLAIFLTFSRGGLMALFTVLGLLGWKARSYVLRVAMIVVLGLSIVVIGAFWSRKDDFQDLQHDTTVNQRIATIKAGWAMFLDRPLFGVGPGCSIVAYPLYVPAEAHCGCQDMLVVHNAFFQVLGELGALGFIPWMTFLLTALYYAWKMQKKGPIPTYAEGLELALWGFLVAGLSGGFSYTWFPYLIIGMIVAAKRISENGEAEGAA